MDYTKDIQLALLYIENNLTGDLSSKRNCKKSRHVRISFSACI